jgi:DNA-binding SARP family transcriptional activator/Tfp pilus assembly protein PilF
VVRLRRGLEPGRPRGAAGQVLITREPGYLLRVPPRALDAARFEELAGQARQALARGAAEPAASMLRAALGLRRGQAFEEFCDTDFAAAEADRLTELRLVAVEDRIEADLRLGRHRELVAELEALVREQPLRERLRGQLMLALYRAGRQAEALDVYRQTRTTLTEELAIDPSAPLRRLERAILSQDPGLELVEPPRQHTQGKQLSISNQRPQISNLPARNLVFTGRGHQLATLRQRPAAGTPAVMVQPLALHGLGGVGKTQLALEYAHRHQGDYDLIWWIAAEQPATVPAQLVALARQLGIPERADRPETVQALWDTLRRRDRWLLVFDNADHPTDLHPWWPPGSGRVLVTSRHPTWGGLATPVVVDVLARAEAIAFLKRRLGSDDPALDRLAEALGELPLALEQAASYLEETASTVNAYLELLRDRGKELFALGHPTATQQTIATVWRVALERLRQQTPAAEDLLVLLAFLSADDIPRNLPTEHLALLPARLRVTVGDPLVYQQTVAALRMLALVTITKDGERLSIHRLLQAVVRHQLDPEQHRQWAAIALRLVNAAFPRNETDLDAWPTYARLLPHALAVASATDAENAEPEMAAGLLDNAGLYLWQRAEDQQARGLYERALAISEAHLGPDHPATAWSLDNLGLVLAAQGDLHGARALHERALAIREARRGANHPVTAHSLDNLARILAAQGDLQSARSLHERALSILEARLGANHLNTLRTRERLAKVTAELKNQRQSI